MYSVNNKSQETGDKFCVMGSRRDQGWIKLIQPERAPGQSEHSNEKQKQPGARRIRRGYT